MGAWGPGIFDNDTALDAMADLVHEADPRDGMLESFTAASGPDYLEAPDADVALVHAAIVKAALGNERLVEWQSAEWTEWQARIRPLDMSALKAPAVRACRRILGAESEAVELWSENEVQFPVWKGNVEAIIRALDG